MTQPLTTADERAQLLANGAARAAGQSIDPLPVVRLFTPDAHATWLLAALDPADGDTAYGLIDLGIGMPALGTVKLSDLAAIVGPQQRERPNSSCANSRKGWMRTKGTSCFRWFPASRIGR